MRVLMSLGHKNLILLLGMRSCNEHEKMPNVNASVLLNEHGHPPLFISKLKFSYDKYSVGKVLNENLLSLLFQRNYLKVISRIFVQRLGNITHPAGICVCPF